MTGIINELKEIGQSEINWSLSYFYDNIWVVKLGDDMNGYKWGGSFMTLNYAIDKLIEAVILYYPTSDYVKRLHERTNYPTQLF